MKSTCQRLAIVILVNCLSLVLLYSDTAWPDENNSSNNAPVAITPFLKGRPHLIIALRLAGKDMAFLIDTGATRSIVDTEHRKLLGDIDGSFQLSASGGVVTLSSYEAPPLYFPNDVLLFHGPLATFDLSLLFKDALPIGVDGILGMDAMEKWFVHLNSENGVAFWWSSLPENTGLTGASVDLIEFEASRHPYVRCDFGGEKAIRVLIDTGSEFSVCVPPDVFERICSSGQVRLTNRMKVTTPAGTQTATLGRVATFSVAGIDLPQRVIATTPGELRASIGVPLLDQFNITFAFPRRKVYWTMRKGRVGLGDHSDADGIGTVVNPDGAIVLEVFHDSPAFAAGARSGDLLTHIAGIPVAQLDGFAIHSAWTSVKLEAITISVLRDGQPLTVVLKRRP